MADDIAILRAGYDAFRRGVITAVLEVLDPRIEWEEPDGYPWGGTYFGHDGVLALFRSAAEALGPEWRVEPEHYTATGDGALVMGHHVGGRAGAEWSVPFAMVWWMRDGRAVRFRQYGDTAAMRRAASA